MARSHDGASKAGRERRNAIRIIVVFGAVVAGLLIAIFAAAHYLRTEGPSVPFACAAKLYSPYDPKNLEQCIAVCMTCSAGVKTTCSTSCTLRGAR